MDQVMDQGDLFGPKVQPLDSLAHPDLPAAIEDDDDGEMDETLSERLIGLTEMFPERLRKTCGSAVSLSISLAKTSFTLGRGLVWVLASSAMVLALPVLIESELAQMKEQELLQQRQMLLGPNAAVSGSHLPPGMAGMPPGMVPPGMGGMPPAPSPS